MKATTPVLNILSGRLYWVVGICNESATGQAQSYPHITVMYRDAKTDLNYTLAKSKFDKLFREASPEEIIAALQ